MPSPRMGKDGNWRISKEVRQFDPVLPLTDSHKYDYLHGESFDWDYEYWIDHEFRIVCQCHYCRRCATLSKAAYRFLKRVGRRQRKGKLEFVLS